MTRYRKSWTQALQEVFLGEALKPIDKSVIDAFYYKKEKEGKLLFSDGDKLEKLGMGRDTVAVWKGHKIVITSQSAVKSDDAILKYMKKSIPKGNFDSKSFSKYFGEEDVEEKIDMDKPGFGGSRHKKIEKDKYNKKRKGQGIEDEFDFDESTGLQLKMAFDDAKIKVKGAKGGKLVIDRNDQKKVTDVLSKSLKKGTNVKKVIDKMIKFEEAEATRMPMEAPFVLDEKGTAYPATIDTLRMIVKDKQHQTVMFKSGKAIVDTFTASAMVQVYDALKPTLKKTFEKMIADKGGFMKTQAFAMKMVG